MSSWRTIRHTLHNRSTSPVELAPWAITQLKPVGLPPNRHLVFWPYTHLDSPHITWGDRHLLKGVVQN